MNTTKKATVEAPAPAARNWRVNFRHTDTGGRARAHPWLPMTVVVQGCASAEEVRDRLRAMLAAAVFQIEPEGA